MTQAFNPNFPPAIHAEAHTLEQECAELGQEHKAVEGATVALARKVKGVYLRFMAAGGVGFFAWFRHHSGIPEGTAHRYLDVVRAADEGFAEKVDTETGVAEPRTITDLSRIGRALREGVPAEQLKANPGAAEKLVEARKNKGLVTKPVTVTTDLALSEAVAVLREEWQAATVETPPEEPELLTYLTTWLREVCHTTQFRRMMADVVERARQVGDA